MEFKTNAHRKESYGQCPVLSSEDKCTLVPQPWWNCDVNKEHRKASLSYSEGPRYPARGIFRAGFKIQAGKQVWGKSGGRIASLTISIFH